MDDTLHIWVPALGVERGHAHAYPRVRGEPTARGDHDDVRRAERVLRREGHLPVEASSRRVRLVSGEHVLPLQEVLRVGSRDDAGGGSCSEASAPSEGVGPPSRRRITRPTRPNGVAAASQRRPQNCATGHDDERASSTSSTRAICSNQVYLNRRPTASEVPRDGLFEPSVPGARLCVCAPFFRCVRHASCELDEKGPQLEEEDGVARVALLGEV